MPEVPGDGDKYAKPIRRALLAGKGAPLPQKVAVGRQPGETGNHRLQRIAGLYGADPVATHDAAVWVLGEPLYCIDGRELMPTSHQQHYAGAWAALYLLACRYGDAEVKRLAGEVLVSVAALENLLTCPATAHKSLANRIVTCGDRSHLHEAHDGRYEWSWGIWDRRGQPGPAPRGTSRRYEQHVAEWDELLGPWCFRLLDQAAAGGEAWAANWPELKRRINAAGEAEARAIRTCGGLRIERSDRGHVVSLVEDRPRKGKRVYRATADYRTGVEVYEDDPGGPVPGCPGGPGRVIFVGTGRMTP
jgi:hypothetical protein